MSIYHVNALCTFHGHEQQQFKNKDIVGFSLICPEITLSPVLSFKKARTIAPLYTGGPVAITHNGLWLVTCIGEQALLTDLESGAEICRFAGVSYQFVCI
jgi:hypothetical protein